MPFSIRRLLIFFLLFSSSAFGASFNQKDGVFLNGYDPVSYIRQNKAMKGKPSLSTEHNGVKFYFSSDENKTAFEAEPEKYVPGYNGWCAYAMANGGDLVEVDPKSFKVIEGRVYLFYNGFFADTLKKWNKKPDAEQVQRADATWTKKHLKSGAQ